MLNPRTRDPGFADVMGKNIARYREAMGISQENLGLSADLHRTAVGQLERGERVARSDTVVRLCGSLGIEPNALFEGLSWKPAEYSRGELIVQLKEMAL
ncbi:MAG TPA: helix-turn-helix transcriptional regulator [Solirubrobacterales bacterium]|jgi:transcriptional regulator with XRE-family HTH domain